MSSAVDKAILVAGRIFAEHTRQGREPLTEPLVRSMLCDAFARGVLWGILRAQDAVAITYSRYRSETGEPR